MRSTLAPSSLPCPIVTGRGERAYALRDSTCSVDGAEPLLFLQHRDDVSGELYPVIGDAGLFSWVLVLSLRFVLCFTAGALLAMQHARSEVGCL